MKNLKKLYDEVIADAKKLGIPFGTIVDVSISTRATKRYGNCRYLSGRKAYAINISAFLLEDNVRDQAVKDTLMHEVLHTCPNCMNHKSPWLRQADKVNRAKLGYTITRTTAREDKGLPPLPSLEEEDFKYIFKCNRCGVTVGRQRASDFTKHPEKYQCRKCHGKFIPIKMPKKAA